MVGLVALMIRLRFGVAIRHGFLEASRTLPREVALHLQRSFATNRIRLREPNDISEFMLDWSLLHGVDAENSLSALASS